MKFSCIHMHRPGQLTFKRFGYQALQIKINRDFLNFKNVVFLKRLIILIKIITRKAFK